jgi:hypothetical protein
MTAVQFNVVVVEALLQQVNSLPQSSHAARSFVPLEAPTTDVAAV